MWSLPGADGGEEEGQTEFRLYGFRPFSFLPVFFSPFHVTGELQHHPLDVSAALTRFPVTGLGSRRVSLVVLEVSRAAHVMCSDIIPFLPAA